VRKDGGRLDADRSGTVMLASAVLILLVSAALFAQGEVAGLRSVHVVSGSRPVAVWLHPGSYSLDQDPIAAPGKGFYSVTGPDGPVHLRVTSFNLSPSGIAGPLLGLGMFSPAATFSVSKAGRYWITIRVRGLGKIFVTDNYGHVAAHTAPWIACMLVALVLGIVSARRLRRLRGRGRAAYERRSEPGFAG
jgi:hypothetical protein